MSYIRNFTGVGLLDLPLVGGKNASLGEMVRHLGSSGVRVPGGFATTVEAYHAFLDYNGLTERIAGTLASLDVKNIAQLEQAGSRIRAWIEQGEMPAGLAEEIAAAYGELGATYGKNPDVAVRSSATAEDLPNASFAGQQDTYLNVRGLDALLVTCRRVYASLFNDRAISYRAHQDFAHDKVGLSIGVQKMVRADIGAAGVMFTLDTETGFRDVVMINAAYGLGENVVQGAVNPDEFYCFQADTRRRPVSGAQAPPGREGHQDGVRHGRGRDDVQRQRVRTGAAAVLSHRRRGTRTRGLCGQDRETLFRRRRPRRTHGHRMGQGRYRRQTLYLTGATGDGAIARKSQPLRYLPSRKSRPRARERHERWAQDRRRSDARHRQNIADEPVTTGRGIGDGHDRSRLGSR